MKIIVLSDIHDHIDNLRRVLERARGSAVVCCGDLCAPFVIEELARRFEDGPIHVVFGNNDGDGLRIAREARRFERVTLHGEFARIRSSGSPVRTVGVHHLPEVGRPLACSGEFDLVCFGHTHEFDQGAEGDCLWVNPGEVMGRKGPVTWAEYDSTAHRIERREL